MATVLFHNRYYDYNFGPQHPFSPVRQEMALDLLDALGRPVDAVGAPIATADDVRTVHSDRFVRLVVSASDGQPPNRARKFGLDTGDVPVFKGMDEASRALVGGTLHGARLIADGEAKRVLQFGGGLHHAQEERASGFCVYNDLSIAIESLRSRGLRVAYVDIDVHHGDGVQYLHYTDPGVLTVSLHETGTALFPGTGSVDEIGDGPGKGYAVNVPLAPFTESKSYLDVFDRVVPYALDAFAPDVLIAQCGADAHVDDPLADLMLTTHTYETLFRSLLDLADEHTKGRILCTLGGGYHFDSVARIWTLLALILRDNPLPSQLPDAWLDRWQERIDDPLTPTLHDSEQQFEISRRSNIEEQNRRASKRVMELLAPYWY